MIFVAQLPSEGDFTMIKRIYLLALIGAAAALALPGMAFAVDGQVLITQARAMAGGVTAGDAPGFPVTISEPGSYKLGSNLVVPDGNTNAIVIDASHVTIDLNGFAILGPADCSGGFPCAGAGSGDGIRSAGASPLFNVTIRNGTIQGMGDNGISLAGDMHLIEYVHVRSNGSFGIIITTSTDSGSSILQYVTAQRNRLGLHLDKGAIRHSVADVNGGDGITVLAGSASYNVATRNAQFGLVLGINNTASYFGNVMRGNGLGHVFSGVNLGQNLCDSAVCP